MAYRRVDPGPFLPPGFSAAVVQHRGIMVRSVSQRLPPFHEDWAIINIHPLPEHEVLFPAVRDVVREYLVEHHRVGVRAIQRRIWDKCWCNSVVCSSGITWFC